MRSEKPATSEFTTRVVRDKPADRQFDIEFWQAQGDEAIFAAVWEMICMVEQLKHGRQPTFHQTVIKVKRSSPLSGNTRHERPQVKDNPGSQQQASEAQEHYKREGMVP
jgi:hypothetical protein